MNCIFRNRKPMTGRTQRLTQRQMASHTLGWLRMFRAVPGRGETDCWAEVPVPGPGFRGNAGNWFLQPALGT